MAITVKTSTTTFTTETTLTTDKPHKYAPTYYYPIAENDFDTKKYFEDRGIPVVTINRYGKERWFALVPDPDFATATEHDKETIYNKSDTFSRKLDNMRRTEERKFAKIKKSETSSLDSLMATGYDPTLDVIKVGIVIAEDEEEIDVQNVDETDAQETEGDVTEDSNSSDSTYADSENDAFGFKPTKARGMYNSFNDDGNPEYIYAKSLLYSKLYKLVGDLDKEGMEIINMIISGTTEREKAKELGIPQTTLSSKKKKLMAKFKKELKDFEDLR